MCDDGRLVVSTSVSYKLALVPDIRNVTISDFNNIVGGKWKAIIIIGVYDDGVSHFKEMTCASMW